MNGMLWAEKSVSDQQLTPVTHPCQETPGMAQDPSPRTPDFGLVEIRDSEIDVLDIMKRVRRNLNQRFALPDTPLELRTPQAVPSAESLAQLNQLHHEFTRLRQNVSEFGTLFTHRPGLLGKLILTWKRGIRFLIRQQLFQIAEVFSALLTLNDHLLNQISAQEAKLEELSRQLRVTPMFEHLHCTERFVRPFAEIQAGRRKYLPWLSEADKILDIGCGRGELVELLWDAGLAVRGVDSNPQPVRFAKERGLPVELRDGFDALASLPFESLGGVVLLRLVEYFPAPQMVGLLRSALSRLKPGGVLLVETLNPGAPGAAANFGVNLGHVQAPHPAALVYLLEDLGCREIALLVGPQAERVTVPVSARTDPQAVAALAGEAPEYAVLARK